MNEKIRNKSNRLKILVSAYACEPNKGSEPGVGWNLVKELSRNNNLWVITKANNRKVIEKEIQENPLPNISWVYFDLPKWLCFWKKGNRGIHLYYYLWQIGIFFLSRKLLKSQKFDLIHHLTFGQYWLPSFLSFLPSKFLWGPIGGGKNAPLKFFKYFSLNGKLKEILRWLFSVTLKLNPLFHLMKMNANKILAISNQTSTIFYSNRKNKIQWLSQVGISKNDFDKLSQIENNQKSNCLTLAMIGRLQHWKGMGIGIKAFVELKKKQHPGKLLIIGDGPESDWLKKLAEVNGLCSEIEFISSVSRDKYFEYLSQIDIFLFPSIHEPGAFVIIEAMSTGIPVICLDFGEPATLVIDKETGFTVPIQDPDKIPQKIAESILNLTQNIDLRKKMGLAGQKRVKDHFLWDKKGEFINQIYQEVLANQ